jgi:hypothetical protein
LVEETECSVKTSDLSQEMYKCYHIASSRLKPGTVEMKLTALMFNEVRIALSFVFVVLY